VSAINPSPTDSRGDSAEWSRTPQATRVKVTHSTSRHQPQQDPCEWSTGGYTSTGIRRCETLPTGEVGLGLRPLHGEAGGASGGDGGERGKRLTELIKAG
jgi:hypothetical protein